MKRLLVTILALPLAVSQLLLPTAFAQDYGAQISVAPTSVQCGGAVSLSGSGWPVGSTVTIDVTQLSPAYVSPVQVPIDQTGSFSDVALSIPVYVPSGSYTVLAETTGIVYPNKQPVRVAATAPLAIACSALPSAPTLQVQPPQVAPGGTITVVGTGFPAGVNVSLLVGPQGSAALLAQTVTTDSSGNLTAYFTIPLSASNGPYAVTAQIAPVTLLSATFQVVSAAQITSISPNPAAPGSTVALSAIDLPVDTAITAVITCNGGSTQATGTTDGNGQLSLSFQVPTSATSGQCQIQLDENGQVVVSGTFQIQRAGTITLSPSAVPGGSSVTVSGADFLPNSNVTAQVTVTLTNGTTQTVVQSSLTNGSGSFSLALAIPSGTLPGSYLVGVYQNGTTTATATASLTVTQAAAIQLVPSTQAPGSSSFVTVVGTGFEANEAVVVSYQANVTTGGQQTVSVTGQANSSGNITIALPVPATLAGGTTYTVTARGQTSGVTASAQLTLSLSPQLLATPSTVNSGGTVSISGQQFPVNTTVTVTAQIPLVNGGLQPVSSTAQIGSGGTFSVQIPIPATTASGSLTFTASATSFTGQTSSATTTVTVTHVAPAIILSSTTTAPASQITVSGTGFAPGPNALITLALSYVTITGQQTATQMIDASAGGTFTTVLTVPGNAISGTATLTASQASGGATASTTLTIRAPLPTPPPAPVPAPSPTPVFHRPAPLRIRLISLWYPAVRAGTFEHIKIRTNKKMSLPVAMVVAFPNGQDEAYAGFTTNRGIWVKTFPVPLHAAGPGGGLARIQITVKRHITVRATTYFAIVH